MQQPKPAIIGAPARSPARRLLDAIQEHPVDVVAAAALIVVGLLLSNLVDEPWARLTGGGCAMLGGLVVSWALAETFNRERYHDQLKGQLGMIRLHLASVSADISRALLDDAPGEQQQAIQLVEQSAGQLITILTDLDTVIGGRLDRQELLDAHRQMAGLLDELAEIASTPPRTQGEVAELAQRVQEFRNELMQVQATLVQPADSRQMVSERVQCPACGRESSVSIGSLRGDSALPTCAQCGTRYHVNRLSDGQLITRPMGGRRSGATLQTDVTGFAQSVAQCPNCGNEIRLRVGEGTSTVETRWCLNCYSRLQLRVTEQAAEVLDCSTDTPLDGKLIGEEFGKTVIQCPRCAHARRSFAAWKGSAFAVCFECDGLLRVEFPPPPQKNEAP